VNLQNVIQDIGTTFMGKNFTNITQDAQHMANFYGIQINEGQVKNMGRFIMTH
jgi:hypothetical protein